MSAPAGQAPLHVSLRPKGQLTLPQAVRREVDLDEGDDLLITVEDGRVVLTPAALIPRDQQGFWTDEWQAGEREADAALAAGRVRRYDSTDDFLADLERGVEDFNPQ